MLQLHDLPNETLCSVIHYLDTEQDINALAQTNRHFYSRTNALLYHHNAIHQRIFALLWAADRGVLNTAEYAVHASQRVSNRVDIFYQALSIAIQAGHTSIAKLLLSQEGVDPNIQYQDKEDEFCITFLARAAQAGNMDMINLLLSTKMLDPNLGDDIGRPPIAYAGFSGQDDVVKKLLSTPGVDPNLKDLEGRTPLSWTVSYGSEVAVSHFLSQPDVDVNAAVASGNIFKIGWTPLMFSVNRRATGMVKLLLQVPNIDAEHQSKYGNTALHFAVSSRSEELVQLLLEKGVIPDTMSRRFSSPLVSAACSGHLPILRLLYEAGANPDAATRSGGDTALIIASDKGYTDMVRFLLETKKVDPAAQDKENKRNPLSLAAENGHREIVDMLLMQDGHGNPDAKDYKGRTPLSYAVENGDLEIIKSVVAKSSAIDLSEVDVDGGTLLSYAPERFRPEIKELLTAPNGVIQEAGVNCS